MANRVSSSFDNAQVDNIRDQLTDVLGKLRESCIVMTADERLEMPKARKNYEKYLKLELQMAKDLGISIPAFPHDAIQSDLKMQEDMTILLDLIATLHTMVLDTYRAARSESWQAFLNYYHMLNALSIQNPELKTRMKPVLEFMSRSARKAEDSSDDDGDMPAELD